MKRLLIWISCSCAALAVQAEPAAPAAVPPPAAATPAAAPAAPAGHAPKIVCEQPTFDFGQTEPGSTVTHDFTIKNGGDLTLQITRVQPSCGCTVAKISSQTIKPGETANITANLNLAGRPPGHQEKHILVESNDPQTPTLLLHMRGDVRQDIQLAPDRLSPGQIRADQVVEMEVLFSTSLATPVQVKDVRTTLPALKAEVATVEAGKRYKILVKTVPPLAAGPLEGLIQVTTDYPNRPVFEVPFNASVMGAITVVPTKIMLDGATKTPVNRPIIVSPGTATNFKILGIESPDPSITVEQTPFGPVRVRIQVNNIVAKPELNGKAIKITTDVEGMKEIFVPFEVVQPPPPPPVSGAVAAPPHS